jgi:phytoene synthase
MSTATVDSLDTRADEDQWIWAAFYHHSRTFSLAARFLPGPVQMPIATLYLFCRRVDTIADDRILEVGPAQALDEVHDVKHRLDETLDGRPPGDDLLWPRLAEVHNAYALQREPLYELIDGAIWDLTGRPVETADDLIAYSNLVGGSVGAMMLPFLAEPGNHAALEEAARNLGIAMQITNIVRDVGEDARQLDRVYLPTTWMEETGVARSDLEAKTPTPAYRRLLERMMEAAEMRYEAGFEGVADLPRRMRLGIRGAARMYREILNEVRANDYNNLANRAYASFGRKLLRVVYDGYDRRKRSLRPASLEHAGEDRS